jgi:glycosyl transferase family 1
VIPETVAQLLERAYMASGTTPSMISLVIRTRNRAPRLSKCLDSVEPLSGDPWWELVVLEWRACGAVVVASAVGGIHEIIAYGKTTGFLVRPNHPKALGEANVRTLNAEPMSTHLVGAAQRSATDEFSLARMALKYRNFVVVRPRSLGIAAPQSAALYPVRRSPAPTASPQGVLLCNAT